MSGGPRPLRGLQARVGSSLPLASGVSPQSSVYSGLCLRGHTALSTSACLTSLCLSLTGTLVMGFRVYPVDPRASPRAQWVKNLPAVAETQETQVQYLGWEDLLENKLATQSNNPAWEIPSTEEPGGL